MATRERRLAQNEAAFRDLNERIGEHRTPDEEFVFICECSREGCQSGFAVNIEQYEHIRSTPDHFALCAGHERSEIERVIEELDRYLIVEKLGEASEEARRRDPRS